MPLVRATRRSKRACIASGMPRSREVARGGAVVEDAQHDALAVQRRQRRHAEVDAPLRQRQADAAVLRHAALGDVETGHDLHPAHHRLAVLPRRARDVREHAVQPVANADAVAAASRWMSLAFALSASRISTFTSLMTGACVASARRSSSGASDAARAAPATSALGAIASASDASRREHRRLNLGRRVLNETQRAAEQARQLVRDRRVERTADGRDQRAVVADA